MMGGRSEQTEDENSSTIKINIRSKGIFLQRRLLLFAKRTNFPLIIPIIN
jgi:hypothetical protein